ncbi:hypothetical protein ACSBR1_025636 [Camellia fascicularis]
MATIERKSSIENEPRTLSMNQIQFARDAALYVLNTRSIEEAMRIFTKDLQPVVTVAEQNEKATIDFNEHSEGTTMDFNEEFNCFANELQIPLPREIASSPF